LIAQLTGDRPLVDLADRRGGQGRQRDQHVQPGMRGHPALVEVGVQLRKVKRRSSENNCGTYLFTNLWVGYRDRSGGWDRRVARQLLFEGLCGDRSTAAADDIFDAAGDLQVAVFPEPDQVAAAVEPVAVKAAFVRAIGAKVAVEGIRPAYQ